MNSIQTGFHKALSAIVDGNITTLIAALVLGILRIRKRKRFRLYPGYGYRAFHVQRSGDFQISDPCFLCTWFARDEKYYGEAKGEKAHRLPRQEKDLLHHFHRTDRYRAGDHGYHRSATGNGALNYSLEFKGGTSTNVTFNEDMSIVDIDSQGKTGGSGSNWRRRHSDSESNRNQSGHHQDQNSGSVDERSSLNDKLAGKLRCG